MDNLFQNNHPPTTISATPNFSVNKPLDYLTFSNNAYAGTQMPPPAGWQLLSNIGENSGYQNAVFINPTTKEIVIAHRGTDLDTELWKDGTTDLTMYLWETKQEKQAEAITKLVTDAYGKEYTIQHTGHSLGGFLAGEMALRFNQQAVTFDSPGIDSYKWPSKEAAAQLIVNYQSAPNLVNFVPKSGISFTNPNTIQLNPNAVSNLDNHNIYDYMRHFFDPNTGKVYEEPMLTSIRKALDLVRKYKDVIKSNQDIIKSNERKIIAANIQRRNINQAQLRINQDQLRSDNKLVQSKIDGIYKELNKINKPNYRQTLPQSANPNQAEVEAVNAGKNVIISTKLKPIKFSTT